jgi:hypothetical protein
MAGKAKESAKFFTAERMVDQIVGFYALQGQ